MVCLEAALRLRILFCFQVSSCGKHAKSKSRIDWPRSAHVSSILREIQTVYRPVKERHRFFFFAFNRRLAASRLPVEKKHNSYESEADRPHSGRDLAAGSRKAQIQPAGPAGRHRKQSKRYVA